MSANGKAPLTSTLFDDEAPTTQRQKLPEAGSAAIGEDLECELSAADLFLTDLDDPPITQA
jgi:hypothetical protein